MLSYESANLLKEPLRQDDCTRAECVIRNIAYYLQSLEKANYGGLSICERIGTSPSSGTIAEGVDKDKTIHTYIDDYLAQTKPLCENCWAFNICPMCYAACFDKGGVNIKKKSFACQNCRTHTYLMLGTFCTLMEERPDALEVLDRSVLL